MPGTDFETESLSILLGFFMNLLMREEMCPAHAWGGGTEGTGAFLKCLNAFL